MLGDFFDERTDGTRNERAGDSCDLGVHHDKGKKCVVDVRMYSCRKQVVSLSTLEAYPRERSPVGFGA